MKVLIEIDCAAQGAYLEAGKVYELDSNVAAELILIGRAVEAPAEEPKPAMNSQQNKMVTCNKEAAGKKGDERKQFMSECLKAKPEAAAAPADDGCDAKATEKKLAGAAKTSFEKKCTDDAIGKKS